VVFDTNAQASVTRWRSRCRPAAFIRFGAGLAVLGWIGTGGVAWCVSDILPTTSPPSRWRARECEVSCKTGDHPLCDEESEW
jgi:hypothetical protein